MRRKKGQAEMMQEAIDKASELIELLQRENKDLKKRVSNFEKDMQKLKNDNRELSLKNEGLVRKIGEVEENYSVTLKELEQNRQAFGSIEQSLKKRINTNKELHQKISILTAKLKEKTKEVNDEKTKMLSLENENQYLVKKLTQNDEKQNFMSQKIFNCHSNRQQQLKQAIKLKEAFARRCEELKADNQALILAAAEYKQKSMQRNPSNQTRHRIKHFKKQETVERSPPKQQPVPSHIVETLITKILKDKLGVNPQKTVEKQYEQLCSFIDYRLSHLNTLWQGIFTKIQRKDYIQIHNLKDLHIASQRILLYVGDLIGKAS